MDENKPLTFMGLKLGQHATILLMSATASGLWSLALKTGFPEFFWSTIGCWVFFQLVWRPKKDEAA